MLEAEGENYIVINLITIIQTLTNIGRIVLLILEFNIIVVQSTVFIFSLIQTLYIMVYIKKHYRWIDLSFEPNYNAVSQKGSVLIHQVSGLIFNNTDIVILSLFTNLKIVSVYTLYNMIFTVLKNAMNYISNGVSFALGQLYANNQKLFLEYYELYELYYTSLAFSLSSVLFVCTIPFMKLYTAGINDINYIDKGISILFTLIILLLVGRTPSRQTIDIAGHFRNTQKQAIVESMLNLTVTLALVTRYGIYGVLIGTIVALLYRFNDMIRYANKILLRRSPWATYKMWLLNFGVFSLFYVLFSYIEIEINSYIKLIGFAIICFIISGSVFFVINSILFKDSFINLVALIRSYLNSNRKL
ncbi:hypothetical protein [Tepidibacillus marianensis]|uniref:hypothetical protein n=1 Tax=Tepidibacillus marianensis TaxID=3131995 RepID=UPI0030D2329C